MKKRAEARARAYMAQEAEDICKRVIADKVIVCNDEDNTVITIYGEPIATMSWHTFDSSFYKGDVHCSVYVGCWKINIDKTIKFDEDGTVRKETARCYVDPNVGCYYMG